MPIRCTWTQIVQLISYDQIQNAFANSECSDDMPLPLHGHATTVQTVTQEMANRPGVRSRPIFGPSRPIKSMPPARKGGRRGPLSAWQRAERKRAKMQGICIRCRKMKTKASEPFSPQVLFGCSCYRLRQTGHACWPPASTSPHFHAS